MKELQHDSTTGAQLAPWPKQSRSKRHPPVMQRAALLPNTPAGRQMGLSPVQSAAVLHASLTHTLVGMMTGPAQPGCAGPSTHLLGGGPIVQSVDLQHCPAGT